MARIDNISKTFNPNEAEPRLYNEWLDKGYFKPSDDKTKTPPSGYPHEIQENVRLSYSLGSRY